MKGKGVIITLIVIVLLVIGFVMFNGNDEIKTDEPSTLVFDGNLANVEWDSAILEDVNSGESFSIGEFDGPVLLESFAVWCPTCTRQQKIMKEFHEEVGDSVISIGLDTDPNEDAAKIREHTNRNGFDWRYAVSPPELTRQLIDEFGPGIVNAPSVPMVLICENGDFVKLGSGIKDLQELKSAISSC